MQKNMAKISRFCSSLVWLRGNKFSYSNISWKSKDNSISCAGSWHAGVAGLGSGANTSGFDAKFDEFLSLHQASYSHVAVRNWLKCLMLMEVTVVVKCWIRTQSDESLQIKLCNFLHHVQLQLFRFGPFSKLTVLQEVQGDEDSFQGF